MKPVARRVQSRLRELLRLFPCVLITGPRRCGKSTLARLALPTWSRVDLERSSDFAAAQGDPEAFLQANSDHVLIDEAQRVPELFAALRPILDGSTKKGRLIAGVDAPLSLGHGIEVLPWRDLMENRLDISKGCLHRLPAPAS